MGCKQTIAICSDHAQKHTRTEIDLTGAQCGDFRVQHALSLAGEIATPARQRAPAFAQVVGEIAMQEFSHCEALLVDQVPQAAVSGIPGMIQVKVADEHVVQVGGAKHVLDVWSDDQGSIVGLPVGFSRIHQQGSASGPDDQCAAGLARVDVMDLEPARLPGAATGRLSPRNGGHLPGGHQAAAGQQQLAQEQEGAHAELSTAAQ